MKTLISTVALIATAATAASAWTQAELDALAMGIHSGEISTDSFVNTAGNNLDELMGAGIMTFENKRGAVRVILPTADDMFVVRKDDHDGHSIRWNGDRVHTLDTTFTQLNDRKYKCIEACDEFEAFLADNDIEAKAKW